MRPSARRRRRIAGIAALAAALATVESPGGLRAQLPPPENAGASGSLPAVARVRGVGAVRVNPAGLALPGGRRTAVLLPSPRAHLALAPVGVGDLIAWGDRDVPLSAREAWLREVEDHGGERGRAAAALTWLAARRGNLGVHVTSTLATRARLNPDAAELLLFGNAGRTGAPRPLAPAGSSLDAWALSRAAVAAASSRPLHLGRVQGTLAVGGSLGLTVGHGLMLARDAGSRVTGGDPTVEVSFPRLETDGLLDPAGWGVDLDLGAAWEGGPWSLGAVVTNAVSTFRWSREALRYRTGRSRLGGESTEGEAPVPDAVPRALLHALDEATPVPVLTLEASRRLSARLELSAATRNQLGSGFDAGADRALGASLAWGATSGVTLHAGWARTDDGTGWRVAGHVTGPGAEAAASLEMEGGAPRRISVGLVVGLGGDAG